MRKLAIGLLVLVAPLTMVDAKKTVSPETSAGNDLVDIIATISLSEDEVKQKIGADPGKGIVLLQVRVIPKTDQSVRVTPDDFILLAHNDGERNTPFDPEQLASDGALVVKSTTDKSAAKKTSGSIGFGGMVGGGGGASPGNSKPVTLGASMDDKNKGNKTLLEALKSKELPTVDASQPVEGYLYFELDGKHKLRDLAVLYRGAAGKLNLEFEH